MNYHRARIPGGCYFFTVVTRQRRKLFNNDITIKLLRNVFRRVMNKHPFAIDAIVILPDHLHCIWTLPDGDTDFAMRWRLLKTHVTQGMSDCSTAHQIHPAGSRRATQSVWQHRYWEHVIRNEADFRAHVDYIHYNPVRHGYVKRAADWPWSSFRLYVRRGVLDSDWGTSGISVPAATGRE